MCTGSNTGRLFVGGIGCLFVDVVLVEVFLVLAIYLINAPAVRRTARSNALNVIAEKITAPIRRVGVLASARLAEAFAEGQ